MRNHTVLHNNPYSSDEDEPVPKPRRARMRVRRKESSPTAAANTLSASSILFTLLLVGLVFCIIDSMYIVKYIMDDRHYAGATSPDTMSRIHNIVREIQDSQAYAAASVVHKDTAIRRPTARPDVVAGLDQEPHDGKPPHPAYGALHVDRQELEDHEAAIPLHPERKEDPKVQDVSGGVNNDDKEHLVNLLKEARIPIDEATLQNLPKWSQVTSLYGDRPSYVGLESCSAFRNSGDPADHFISTAGTFNTGTNLMAEYLIHNCHMPARMKKYGAANRGIRWQVTWGKHTPVDDEDFRTSHATYNESTLKAENIFPAVTVRDPYKWMQSMCRHSYGAHWNFTKAHCPNLIPNENDLDRFPLQQGSETVTVRVKYAEFERQHSSLVGFFNDWYNLYLKAPFPRLIVRFEDLVFHPKEVTKTVCECAGGELNRGDFKYITESAKKGKGAHGTHRTTYIDALIKYGTEDGRYANFDLPDLRYANEHLDPNLMKLLRYPTGPDETEAAVV